MLMLTLDTPVFVDAHELINIKPSSPYIQVTDLMEVLQDYFRGDLDDPDLPELICQDLTEWHSNGLWCLIDSSQMDRLLLALNKQHREIIFYRLCEARCDLVFLQSYYVHQSLNISFFEYTENCFQEAICSLSELIVSEL